MRLQRCFANETWPSGCICTNTFVDVFVATTSTLNSTRVSFLEQVLRHARQDGRGDKHRKDKETTTRHRKRKAMTK